MRRWWCEFPERGLECGAGVDESEPRPRDDAQGADRGAVLAGVDMRAHDARERVAIGDPDSRQAQSRRLRHEFLRVRSAAKKREVGRRRQLGEAGRESDHLPFSRSSREKVARSAG